MIFNKYKMVSVSFQNLRIFHYNMYYAQTTKLHFKKHLYNKLYTTVVDNCEIKTAF